ncbi:hypothetical protein [Actinophytocola xinjiangensis]|uniref:hypothetical protein n=1 Tax=Actinophytocola xinjiangensis TaxID=485602 RepID=UPI000B1C762D|nr:hypothetical protein [Actinophytocola xinjiangensis]
MTEPGRAVVAGNLMRALRLTTLTVAAALLLVFALPLLVADPGLYRSLGQQVVAFALLVAVAVVAGVAVVRDRPVGRVRWALVAAVFAASALATTGVAPADLMAEGEWSYGLIGWFLLLVLIDHGTTATLVALGVFTAGSFAQLVAVGQGHEVADLVVVTTAVLGCELPVLAIAMALRRIAGTAADAAVREERTRTEDAIAERLHADRRDRYAELASTTVPLLRALTDGTADLTDPLVRADYAVAASRLRRLFAEHDEVHDPLVHELRACLDLAERTGVVVYLGTCGDHPTPPLAARRALTEPALRAMATADTRARITVLGSPGGVTVSILTDGVGEQGEPLGDNDVGVTVTRLADGPDVWVEATWTATS